MKKLKLKRFQKENYGGFDIFKKIYQNGYEEKKKSVVK